MKYLPLQIYIYMYFTCFKKEATDSQDFKILLVYYLKLHVYTQY